MTPRGWIAYWQWHVREQFSAGMMDGYSAFSAWCELEDMEARLSWQP